MIDKKTRQEIIVLLLKRKEEIGGEIGLLLFVCTLTWIGLKIILV